MGKLTEYDTGATRDSREGKLVYDKFLSPVVLEQFAKYMNMNRVQSDGELRPGDNWQRGISMEDYVESLMRHFVDFWKEHRGIETEAGIRTALCGMMFNVMGYLHEYLKLNKMRDFDGDEPTPEMVRRLAETSQEHGGEPFLGPGDIQWPDCAARHQFDLDDSYFDAGGKDMADQIDSDILNNLLSEAKASDDLDRDAQWVKSKTVKIPNLVHCNCEYCNPDFHAPDPDEEWPGLCFGNYDSETCPGCPDHDMCRDAFGPDKVIIRQVPDIEIRDYSKDGG